MVGRFVLVLHTHLPYVIRHGTWPHGADWLFEAAAECYIPILNELNGLRSDGIEAGVTISFSPVVLEQLADEEFPTLFEDYLEARAQAADEDALYFEGRPGETDYAITARYWSAWYRDRRADFVDRYDRDLPAAFLNLQDAGAIALQTCGATHGYFPLLGYDRAVRAQIGTAARVHARHFRHASRGIWMPECAYRPAGWWRPLTAGPAPEGYRLGVEQPIAAAGMEYTIVDAHLVQGGEPYGWSPHEYGGGTSGWGRILPPRDPWSVYEIYRIHTRGSSEPGNVSIFARDVRTSMKVWSAEEGYPGHGDYLEFHKKHHLSGHRYWRITGRKVDLGEKERYRPEWTDWHIRFHAEEFARIVERRLTEYHAATGRVGTLCAPFDTELFGHWWFEGPRFLGLLLRTLAERGIVDPKTCAEAIDESDPGLPIDLPEGSWGADGDHHVWLNEQTAWTWPLVYDAEARLLELVESRDRANELEERLLKQAARELLLLEASDWQFLITTGGAVDYATDRFRDHYDSLVALCDYARELKTGIDRRDRFEELCRLESRDRLFPDIDLDDWSS